MNTFQVKHYRQKNLEVFEEIAPGEVCLEPCIMLVHIVYVNYYINIVGNHSLDRYCLM